MSGDAIYAWNFAFETMELCFVENLNDFEVFAVSFADEHLNSGALKDGQESFCL